MPTPSVGVNPDGDLVSWFDLKHLPWAHGFNISTPGDGMIWGRLLKGGGDGGNGKLKVCL